MDVWIEANGMWLNFNENGKTEEKDKLDCSYKGCRLVKQDGVKWYSYDPNTYNFHMTPEITIENEDDLFKNIAQKLEESSVSFEKKYDERKNEKKIFYGYGRGNLPWTHNHIFNYCRIDDNPYEYLILLGRLWIDKNDCVKNAFEKVQFFKYRWRYKNCNNQWSEYQKKSQNINWGKDGKFDMMYPYSGDDGAFCYNVESGHCVFNPPGLRIDSEAEDIAEEFLKFINDKIIFDGDSDENNHIYGNVQEESDQCVAPTS